LHLGVSTHLARNKPATSAADVSLEDGADVSLEDGALPIF
jgi:hypothetical protein